MDHSGTSQSHCIMMYRRGRVVDAMVAQLEFRAGGKGILLHLSHLCSALITL